MVSYPGELTGKRVHMAISTSTVSPNTGPHITRPVSTVIHHSPNYAETCQSVRLLMAVEEKMRLLVASFYLRTGSQHLQKDEHDSDHLQSAINTWPSKLSAQPPNPLVLKLVNF